MGGNALNQLGIKTVRKNSEEFHRIGVQLKYKIKMTLNLESEVIACYREKASHGDLDLLIRVPNSYTINWNQYIKDRFAPRAVHSSGGVHSFDYEDFQIDFIPIKESIWDIAKVYFSNDPSGNILGKSFHKFGLSYGWDGLSYKFRNFNGTLSKKILISTDPRKIFEFGGYDYDRFLLGFDTLEEIFEFVIDSKYFDSEIFKFENLKYIDRKRNRKRGSYKLFLDYLANNNVYSTYPFEKDKNKYVVIIDQYFPEANLLNKLEVLRKNDDTILKINQKFNGDVVMAWLPELKGKELGNALRKFREFYGKEFNSFILNSDDSAIKNSFMKIYNE